MEEKNDDLTYKKDNYKINISLKANHISLIIIDSLTNEEYKRIFSEEYFSKKNSFFSYFSIIGIKDFLINAIKDPSKYNITKDNKNLALTIPIEKLNEKLEILIPISEAELSTEDNIIILKNENIFLKEEIKNLKDEINELKKRLKIVEEAMGNNKEEWRGFTNKIIKNKNEVKRLLNWIDPNEKYRVKLLYDASLEENTNKDFHKYCDGKGATITLVESSKGKRFGGYTRISWNYNFKNFMSDSNAFLFNLDSNKKYKVIKPQYAIYGHENYGPHFGQCNDFTPGHPNGSKLFIGGSHPSNPDNNKTYEAEKNELSGEDNFQIVSMEVYQVNLDNF